MVQQYTLSDTQVKFAYGCLEIEEKLLSLAGQAVSVPTSPTL
jgi:hypothetical protein